jgi:hypothetical protein
MRRTKIFEEESEEVSPKETFKEDVKGEVKTQVQVVTSEQLLHFKLDDITDKLNFVVGYIIEKDKPKEETTEKK